MKRLLPFLLLLLNFHAFAQTTEKGLKKEQYWDESKKKLKSVEYYVN
jgi:hypothetical protein